MLGAFVVTACGRPPGDDDRTPLQHEFAAFTRELLPLFVPGDINEDSRVDETDRALLERLLQSRGEDVPEASCFAAADLSLDGTVDEADLTAFQALIGDNDIAAPALYGQSHLECSYRNRLVAAPLEWTRNVPIALRLLQNRTTRQVQLTLLEGQGEVQELENGSGWSVAMPATFPEDSAVVLRFSLGNASFVYTLVNFTRQDQGELQQETWVESSWTDLDGDGDVDDPSDLPAPTAWGEEIAGVNTCPQKGNGCEALVIDFMKHLFHVDADLTKGALEQIGCNVLYVAPVFVPRPKPLKVLSHSGRVRVIPPSDAAVARAVERNRAMWATIRTAIAAHRANVSAGRELVLQLVNGHGTGGGSYGDWGPGFSVGGGDLSRGDFHQGNYIATRGKACNAIAMDWSCYSGMTPKVVERLNNTGDAAYADTPAMNHGYHAAFWGNLAQSQSSSTETCGEISAWVLDVSLAGIIRTHGKHRDYDRLASFGFRPFVLDDAAGKYNDRGYNRNPLTLCQTASHERAY
jgi:hypothetical protein